MNRMKAVVGAKRQRGFSFFEVLVAAMILGIGVLGFAGLQMRALGSTGVAHFRAQASVLAAEMAERIRMIDAGAQSLPGTDPRSNNGALLYLTQDWNPATPLPTTPPASWTAGSQTCIYSALNNTGCSETVMIAADSRELNYMAGQLLPQGRMAVVRCSAGSNLLCVYVGWSGQDPNTCTIAGTNPNCFGVEVML